MEKSITDYGNKNIRAVHSLSGQYNGAEGGHTRVLLDLVRKHACEIEELYAKGDGHFTVEVGDLLILAMELILESGEDIDAIMDLCYGRYRKKLTELISLKD